MEDKELGLLSLSKITTYEILIEEQLEQLETVRFRYFKRYLSSQESLKRRFILSKIFGAVIFGILPVIPLLAYFQVLDFINEGLHSIELILFAGSLLFGIFFLFQFFNFFLMAMLNTMKILSGNIFEWFETLPISRGKLKKLILYTIIRSIDIPLIVITICFPIIMYIGTQNLMIFLICIGVSIIETIFSFSLLVIFSERLNRVLNINNNNSKRTQIIRFINLASYIIIVIGSVFLIQWSLSSITDFFLLFANSDSPRLIILILSMIPFPIAPGYLISSFISPQRVLGFVWYNILIGFTLFLILTYLLYQKAVKGIKKSSYSKLKKEKAPELSENKELVKVNVISPIRAYIRKDLIIAARNLKSFLSLTMPIVIGFIFTFTYNNTNIAGLTPFRLDLITNMFVMIGFNLIVSGMIVYGILNIGESSAALMGSLPLIPKEQANAKLILMFCIQSITVLAPSLMYINTNFFINSITTALWVLPFVLLFLFIMFELRIYFFGKSKRSFLIEEVIPEKKIVKWLLIFVVEYFIYFLLLSFAFTIYIFQGVALMSLFFTTFLIIGFIFTYSIFRRIFTPFKSDYKIKEISTKISIDVISTRSTRFTWILIVILLVLNSSIGFIISFITPPMLPPYLMEAWLVYEPFFLLYVLNNNILFILLWIVITPKFLGKPSGRLPILDYWRKITIGGAEFTPKKVFINVLIVLTHIFLNYVVIAYIYLTDEPAIYYTYYLYILIAYFFYCFWQEFAFRGVIFRLLSNRVKLWKSVVLCALMYSIAQLFHIYITKFYIFNTIYEILIEFLYLFLTGLLLTYVYMKKENIFVTSSIALSFNVIIRFLLLSHLFL